MQEISFESDKKDFMSFAKKKNAIVVAAIITICFIFIAVFSYKYIAPFGKIVNYRFTSKLPGAQPETVFSSGQESVLKIPTQIITTSKSKIHLKLPQGKFESIKAILKFKPKINEIIFGVRGNEKDDFFYQPLYRDIFRDLSWNQVKEEGLTLWQKEEQYQSVRGFLNNPPLDKKIAFYYPDTDKLQKLQFGTIEEDKNTKTTIAIPLRGAHSLLIKVNQGPLVLKVAKQDLNLYEGEDNLKIEVSKNGKNIEEKIIEDDGIIDKSRLKSAIQEEILTLQGVYPGIYRVNLIDLGNKGDILITKIEVNQSRVIFKSNIFPLANTQTTFWTNIAKLNISTTHDLSVQTVKLDDLFDLKIEQADKQYLFDLQELTGSKATSKIYKLTSPKNDLMIGGNGYFSFTKDAFFLPEIIKADNLNDLDNLENVDYILTAYNLPKKEGYWIVAETNIDFNKIKIDGDELYFSLEIPQIAKYGGELEIDSLEIEVKSDGILSKARKEKKEEVKPVESGAKKQNIFSRFFSWVGEKLGAAGRAVASPFVRACNWAKGLFGGISLKLPGQKSAKPTPAPTPTVSASPPPTSKPSPTSTPSTTPASLASIELLVRVLNGGGEKGAAASIAAILRGSGFANVDAGNADRTDYKGATVRYRKEDADIVKILESLLKKEFSLVEKIQVATSTPETVIIIGKK